jgi:hypothetical protein
MLSPQLALTRVGLPMQAIPLYSCYGSTELRGPRNGYSPEKLFGIALINCLFALHSLLLEIKRPFQDFLFQNVEKKANAVINKEASVTSFRVTTILKCF